MAILSILCFQYQINIIHTKIKKSFITIEGDEKYAKFLCDFFKKLGNSTVIVSKENKFLYHAASVVSSNLVLGLINTSVTYLIQCGFTEKWQLKLYIH